MKKTLLVCGMFAVAWMAFPATTAQAQATRTWVSGVGDDINPCSRTSPCKTFQTAYSKTAAGGEISVLDSGAFGAMIIMKSISVVAEGAEGAVTGPGINGITINAGPTDVVSISGLTMEGGGNGLKGIRIQSAGSVLIRKCLIRGFAAPGSAAISVETTAPINVVVDDCGLDRNTTAVSVKAPSQTALVLLDRVTISGLGTTTGVVSDGNKSDVRLTNSTIFGPKTSLSSLNNGLIRSYGNNTIIWNGSPTSVMPLK